jgi:hypothetical protein
MLQFLNKYGPLTVSALLRHLASINDEHIKEIDPSGKYIEEMACNLEDILYAARNDLEKQGNIDIGR